jgi:hypothetical protein
MLPLDPRKLAQGCLDKWDHLGAVIGETECAYVYGKPEDGCGCAIGVNMTLEDRKAIVSDDSGVYLSDGIARLFNFAGCEQAGVSVQLFGVDFPEGCVAFDKSNAVIPSDVFKRIKKLQMLHDGACREKPGSRWRDEALRLFRDYVENLAAT